MKITRVIMNSYKFDWQNTLTGIIEIEAENGTLAEEKLMNMTLKLQVHILLQINPS